MSTGQAKRSIDQRWTEKPLCNKDPRYGDYAVADGSLDIVVLLFPGLWSGCDLEKSKGNSGPEPTALDKKYVYEIVLASPVAGVMMWTAEGGGHTRC